MVEFSSGRSLFLADGFQIFFSCLRYPTRRVLSLFSSARYYLLFYMSTRCYLFFYMSMSHVKKNIVRDHLKIKINQPKNYVEVGGGSLQRWCRPWRGDRLPLTFYIQTEEGHITKVWILSIKTYTRYAHRLYYTGNLIS